MTHSRGLPESTSGNMTPPGRPLRTEQGLHLHPEDLLVASLGKQRQLSILNLRRAEDRYPSQNKTRQCRSWHDQSRFSRMSIATSHKQSGQPGQAKCRSYSRSSRFLLEIMRNTILCKIQKILVFIPSSRSGTDSATAQAQQSTMSLRQ